MAAAAVFGAALLVAGVVMNWRFLYETVAFRGPERRAPSAAGQPEAPEKDPSEKVPLR